MKKIFLFFIIFYAPFRIYADKSVDTWKVKEWKGIRRIWDRNLAPYSRGEIDNFYNSINRGVHNDRKCIEALSAISALECNRVKSLREKEGYLGGKQNAIRKGRILQGSPCCKTQALASLFFEIYENNHSIEKTCKIWNKGHNWKDAIDYWRDCQFFIKIYRSAENG
ncbi:MAG: hypothetical protein ACRDFB_03350 [Rhabdochlamydiaceae bacterium]